GQSLVGLAPHKRPTTTVFQHFALFPHRSVLENVEFGLKMHGVQKDERRKQALDALEMVGLSELADRKPRALSGGQQQRVALARASVLAPGDDRAVGDEALVSVRAAAVEVEDGTSPAASNSAQCEILFVEFLGDLVKLHLTASGERMLAKVSGDRYPAFRGRE